MKRSCKHIDICNPDTLFPWVLDCCSRHKKRYDFRKLFLQHGMTNKQYDRMLKTNDYMDFWPVIRSICQDAAMKIRNRNLELPPVTITEKVDKTTGKVRQIGNESAMQQVFDYIAVHSSMDIFKRRVVYEQVSSIKGRGQVHGMRIIRKWVEADNRAAEYAQKHHQKYTRKCKYFVKLDIEKCYPSADRDTFMDFFTEDCANEDIIWLWQTLLNSHRVGGYNGFMIGALISQWACQYLMSYVYRLAKQHFSARRGKRNPSVKHMIVFMDDILLMGSNKKHLQSAVKCVIIYAREILGWTIKPTWNIRKLDECPIDMMGYVVHADGHVTMRARNFIHSRRLALRFKEQNKIGLCRAKRFVSYKGYYKYSDSATAQDEYGLPGLFRGAAKKISRHDKEKRGVKNEK